MSNRFAGAAEAQTVDFGALGAAMSSLRGGFSEGGAAQFAPATEPKHFRPANPGMNPTEGWDPFDPLGEKSAPPPGPDQPDPVAEAHALGFAEGMAAAERMAAERGEVDVQALARIASALESTSGFDRDALAERLRQTVLMLVTRLVDDSGVDAALLQKRVHAAAGLLADSAETATLRLHPDDLALLDTHVPAGVIATADPSIERGGLRLETRTSAVQDGPSIWLAQLAAALDRAPLYND